MISPTYHGGTLMTYDDLGFCTRRTIFNLEHSYQLSNSAGNMNIPIIFRDKVFHAEFITDDNTFILYKGWNKKNHFDKLDNGFYLIDGGRKRTSFFRFKDHRR